MDNITFKQALSILSKSSPHSISTLGERKQDIYEQLKNYLYVEQEIEKVFAQSLINAQEGDIIFLCGSSGDGKTEILRRNKIRYQQQIRFHSDGTHSFSPEKTAIDTLNELFSESKADRRPLVVGINIGMLANFAKEGNDEHWEIKQTIEDFLARRPIIYKNYQFIDFEQYPKFEFSKPTDYSIFTKKLLQLLTAPNVENIFYQLAEKEEQELKEKLSRQQEFDVNDLTLIANFKLLSKQSVQDIIITNLFKMRLAKDQFVTTRALLDLVHDLLLGEDYLFNNLFSGINNELALGLADYDPALLHTKELDQLVLRFELELQDALLDTFLKDLYADHIYLDRTKESSGIGTSLIRLFYLLRYESISNNYHHQFANDFNDQLLEKYANNWLLHHNYDGQDDSKKKLRSFYMTDLINAIFYYANRRSTNLNKGDLLLEQLGNFSVATNLKLQVDFDRIANVVQKKQPYFYAYLKIANVQLNPIPLTFSLFELIYKLNKGYRPNKYDKNTIVLLDELINQITDIAQLSDELKIYDGSVCYTVSLDDGMIAINGGKL